MKGWRMVFQRELRSLPEYLLVCNLVVMVWTATITDDRLGLFQDFSPSRKTLENCFRQSRNKNSHGLCFVSIIIEIIGCINREKTGTTRLLHINDILIWV
jgi:hypothetical protein